MIQANTGRSTWQWDKPMYRKIEFLCKMAFALHTTTINILLWIMNQAFLYLIKLIFQVAPHKFFPVMPACASWNGKNNQEPNLKMMVWLSYLIFCMDSCITWAAVLVIIKTLICFLMAVIILAVLIAQSQSQANYKIFCVLCKCFEAVLYQFVYIY